MKRSLALILLLAVALFFGASAIGEEEFDGWDDAAEVVEEWPEEGDWTDDDFADEDEPADDAQWEDENAFGDDSDPQNVWLAAMEVYSWFTIQPLDVDPEAPNADGTKWKVLDERFPTMEALEDIAHFYFCDVIVDELLSYELYEEIDGVLYATDEGRAVDDTMTDADVMISERTDTKHVLEVTVQYAEPDADGQESETFTFIREMVDGDWQYTAFPFYW